MKYGLLFIMAMMVMAGGLSAQVTGEQPLFEQAIECIKRYEGWHTLEKHAPYIGYGHRLLPGERLPQELTEAQADSLLRADLRKCCALFRKFGKDSLLIGTLCYNVGQGRLNGNRTRPKSKLIQKLERGDRNIYEEYVSFRKYKGKVIRSIERRRMEEFKLLYIP